MFEWIIDMIMGVKLIAKDEAIAKFADAVEKCDKDEDGYLSVRELIAVFKKVLKDGE